MKSLQYIKIDLSACYQRREAVRTRRYILKKNEKREERALSYWEEIYWSFDSSTQDSNHPQRCLRDQLKKEFSKDHPISRIMKFMQNELEYSYRRGANRSNLSQNPKLVYMQAVFATRMLSWINNSKVIVNIDDHQIQN